jgi:hypothetical protein
MTNSEDLIDVAIKIYLGIAIVFALAICGGAFACGYYYAKHSAKVIAVTIEEKADER